MLVGHFRDYALSRANKSWCNKGGAAIVSNTEVTRSSPAGHPPVSTPVLHRPRNVAGRELWRGQLDGSFGGLRCCIYKGMVSFVDGVVDRDASAQFLRQL